jgi:threonine dehydratase
VTALDLADLRDAQAGLSGVAVRTPLIPLVGIPGILHPVRLKAEFQQPIGAFKIRGAWTAIRRLPEAARARGVVTSSSGNHGLGVAFAAQRLGIRAVVVTPESVSGVKAEGIERLGAELLRVGLRRGPEQMAAAMRLASEEGLALIPPYDHPDVIAGQATCGMEILEDWPEVGTIVVPVGGGGLLAGICSAVRALKPGVRVIAVEPSGIPKLSAAFAAGRPVMLDDGGQSLADGLLTRTVGDLTWPVIRDTVAEVVSVTDQEIAAAVRWLARQSIRVEPSGAVSTAALLAGKGRTDGPVVVVSSGGNVDPARYAELVA